VLPETGHGTLIRRLMGNETGNDPLFSFRMISDAPHSCKTRILLANSRRHGGNVGKLRSLAASQARCGGKHQAHLTLPIPRQEILARHFYGADCLVSCISQGRSG
jgi:hypothetical protein